MFAEAASAFGAALFFYGFQKATKFINRNMEHKKIVQRTQKFFRNISNHLHRRCSLEILVREITEASNNRIKEDDLIKISTIPIEHS